LVEFPASAIPVSGPAKRPNRNFVVYFLLSGKQKFRRTRSREPSKRRGGRAPRLAGKNAAAAIGGRRIRRRAD
jgi:hypothetical protein